MTVGRAARVALALAAASIPCLATAGAAWGSTVTTTTASPSPTTTSPPTTTASPSPTTTSLPVPLDSLILAQPLPGFTAAPAGPTNGPLTATEFASQSASPAQAEQLFDSLGAQPGFGASIRLWTDLSGPGAGANDIAVLLFRINQPPLAQSFENGLNQPFDGTAGSTPFAVPSVPGAHGYTLSVSTPVKATEQVVVFAAGRYVAMIQLASSSAATNPDPLTPAQAVTVSYQELTTLTTGDPTNTESTTTTTPPSSTTTAPPTVPGTTAPVESGGHHGSDLPVVVGAVGAAVVALAVVFGLMVRRRRRPDPTGGSDVPDGDPWGPGGVFAQFGAVDNRSAEGSGTHDRARPPDAVPRSVPEFELTESGAAPG